MKAEILEQMTWKDIVEIEEALNRVYTDYQLWEPLTAKGYRKVLKLLKEKAK